MTTTIQHRALWWARFKWPDAAKAPSGRTLGAEAAGATLHADLAALDARTLRDIGAPDSMLARAHARRENERQERDNLHFGLVAGGGAEWRRG